MINSTCPLVLHDLFFYDFKSAYPRILETIGFDFGDVDLDDKEARNKAIGLAQRGNERLSAFLIESVTQLLNFYLTENGLTDDDIIISQRDGYILKKLLFDSTKVMELDFRGHINLLIITPDRKKYLAIHDDGKIDVKGLRNYYPGLEKVYKMFSRLNTFNKSILYKQLEMIKKEVFSIRDKEFFMVEIGGNKYVQTQKHGVLEVASPQVVKLDSIDRQKYFDHYFKEFLQSIHLEFF